MRPSNLVRRGEQSGQMLVSVIVLLTLMFFIGSAMALAVSSSLHTIAQTNNTDSTAYAAESAVAQGLARDATPNPLFLAPTIGLVLNDPSPLPSRQGCNRGILLPPQPPPGGGNGGDGGNGGGGGGNGGNGGNGSTNAGNVAVPPPSATWSYEYEVVVDNGAGRDLMGRSAVGSGLGPNSINSSNYETITIPFIPLSKFPPGSVGISFEVYRTASGDPGLPTGCIGVFAQQPGGTTVDDPGPTDAAPPMCTRPGAKAAPLSRQVNNYGPGGIQGPLTASTCRVPVQNGAVQMWSAPAQAVAGCSPQQLNPPFSMADQTGTAWGVIGWHAASSANPNPKFRVSVLANCQTDSDCHTRATAPGVLYYWCNVGKVTQDTTIDTLNIVNDGDAALVNAFVMRASPSGKDCVATGMGQAGPVVDESARQMPGCAWTNTMQTLWNRVLP